MIEVCKRGHSLSGDNLNVRLSRGRYIRQCRACKGESNRRYRSTENGLQREREARRRYYASPLGQARRERQRVEQSAERTKAYKLVENDLRFGRTTRQPCLDCGAEKTQAHHPRGYVGAAARDIEWLCAKHHAARHRSAA